MASVTIFSLVTTPMDFFRRSVPRQVTKSTRAHGGQRSPTATSEKFVLLFA